MNADEMNKVFSDYWGYIILLDFGIGLVLGLIPLVLGFRHSQRRMGILGLVISAFTGALTPIFSIVVVGIFLWLILGRSKTGPHGEEIPPEKTPPDARY